MEVRRLVLQQPIIVSTGLRVVAELVVAEGEVV